MMRAEHATVVLARRLLIDPEWTIQAGPAPRDDDLCNMIAEGPAYVVMDGDEVLAIAGALPDGKGNAMAYGFVAASAASRIVAVTRALHRLVEAAPFRRLDLTVRSTDERRMRWLRLLGFVHEGTSRAWASDGGDGERFARIRSAAVPAAALHQAEAPQLFH